MPDKSQAEMSAGAKNRWPGFDPLLPTVGLVALTAFVVLFMTDPPQYQTVVRFWMGDPWSYPFLDLTSHLSHIECFAKGEDVYTTNSCDPIQLNHAIPKFDYSPLWLRLPWLAAIKPLLPVAGLCLAGVFLLALGFLPQPLGFKARAISVFGLLSGVVVFCIERENIDIVMFLLALAGGLCLTKRLAVRGVGYGMILAATLLKFYPAVLFVLVARERPRVALALGAVVASIGVLFVATFQGELHRALGNVPGGSPFADLWGAMILPVGVNELLPVVLNPFGYEPAWTENLRRSYSVAITLYFAIVPLSLACAIRLASTHAIRTASSLPPQAYLFMVMGGLTIAGCFLAGPNIGYRAVWLLLALPGTLTLAETGGSYRLFDWTAAAILVAMWSIPLRRTLAVVVGEQPGRGLLPLPFYVEWLVEQLAWWFLTTVLLAVVFRFAADGTARWFRPSSPLHRWLC